MISSMLFCLLEHAVNAGILFARHQVLPHLFHNYHHQQQNSI